MSKISDNTYYLNIHHRSIAINVDSTSGATEVRYSPGHFYISLQQNEEKEFFGKYSQSKNLISSLFSKEVIESEREEYCTKKLQELEQQTGEKYYSYKSIILKEEQYENALCYAFGKVDGTIAPGNYILAIDDCTDFVQQVYNQAGLPLYFTTVFTRLELVTLGSMAALNVLNKYGASDCLDFTLSSIKSISREALANKLNVDINMIAQNSPDIDLDAPVLSLPSFRVLFEGIELPKTFNVGSTESVDNIHPVIEENQDAFDFSAMTSFLPLTADQKKRSADDMQNFFTGMMHNSDTQSSTDFLPQELFPEIDEDTQEWARNLANETNDMLNGFFANTTSQQFYNPINQNPSNYVYKAMQSSTNLIGQAFNSIDTDLIEEDSLD